MRDQRAVAAPMMAQALSSRLSSLVCVIGAICGFVFARLL
jgi:hypothetical protein